MGGREVRATRGRAPDQLGSCVVCICIHFLNTAPHGASHHIVHPTSSHDVRSAARGLMDGDGSLRPRLTAGARTRARLPRAAACSGPCFGAPGNPTTLLVPYVQRVVMLVTRILFRDTPPGAVQGACCSKL